MTTYVPQASDISLFGTTVFNSDLSLVSQNVFYRPQSDGSYLKVGVASYYTSPQNFNLAVTYARWSLETGIVHWGTPNVVQASSGKTLLGSDKMEAFRYLIADGEYTLAQVEGLLGDKYITSLWPSFAGAGTPPVSVSAAAFNTLESSDTPITFVNSVELLHRTVAYMDDRPLMASLPNGASQPWSVAAGQTVDAAAAADWSLPATFYTLTPATNTAPSSLAVDQGAAFASSEAAIAGTDLSKVGSLNGHPIDNSWLTNPYCDSLEKVYLAYFGRPADLGGLKYYEGVVGQAHGDMSQLVAEFSTSPESQAFYAGKTLPDQVDMVYTQLFNRTAETAGKDYWVNEIGSGHVNSVDMCIAILNGAQNSDLTIVNNRLEVAKYFTEHINVTAYDGNISSANARQLLLAVGDSHSDVTKADVAVDSASYNSHLQFGDTGPDVTLVGLHLSDFFVG